MSASRALSILIALHLGCHSGDVEPATEEAKSTLDTVTEAPGPQGTSPDAIFREGAFEKIQRALVEHGQGVTITRKFDPETEQALIRFQGEQKLPRTGFPDHETLRQLGLDPRDLYLPNATQR